jgi:hypothetical protein
MSRWIEQIGIHLRSQTLKLLFLALALLLLWGILSPIGTLVWWLNQSRESLGPKNQQKRLAANPERDSPSNSASDSPSKQPINCYIVFLPGVGDFSSDQLTPGEELFLDQLVQRYANCVAVRDVFPYSVANKDLGGQRFLAPLWRMAKEADGWLENADVLIKIRNLWRFAISADDRYGEVYNQGIADAILERMNAVYPLSRSQQPLQIVLIGTSGGAQVALGATHYLEQWLDARLSVISIGGVFDGAAGFETADQIYHLEGTQDWIADLGRVLFPSRWPWTVGSPFNRAQRQDRYQAQSIGPHAHDGTEGYFGLAEVNPGTTYVELTLTEVSELPLWPEE